MRSVTPLARSRNEVDAEAAAMKLFRDKDCRDSRLGMRMGMRSILVVLTT